MSGSVSWGEANRATWRVYCTAEYIETRDRRQRRQDNDDADRLFGAGAMFSSGMGHGQPFRPHGVAAALPQFRTIPQAAW